MEYIFGIKLISWINKNVNFIMHIEDSFWEIIL